MHSCMYKTPKGKKKIKLIKQKDQVLLRKIGNQLKKNIWALAGFLRNYVINNTTVCQSEGIMLVVIEAAASKKIFFFFKRTSQLRAKLIAHYLKSTQRAKVLTINVTVLYMWQVFSWVQELIVLISGNIAEVCKVSFSTIQQRLIQNLLLFIPPTSSC